ncbi:MAG: 1,4-dihydroxy-2-naphthoate polyprenyltransferase, partial [Nitriliruptorales bacterium]|nr:1,4-dihydroxy-2-naphthoate polyprenyltransferase [Nitriliruptorales bacterium]
MNPRIWVEAARPRTLPAAVAPVLVGTAVASRLILWRFVLALVVALALQVAVNFANDLFDAGAGVDTAERLGPRRVVAAGLVAPQAMRRAMLAALGVAGAAGLALAAAVGWELVLVGLASGLAALGYSGGRRPYASLGLGELFVFVFFGLVATVGSQYVQDEAWRWIAVLVAVPVGLVAVAILVVNNLRDIPTDAPAGKATLAVRLGDRRTRILFGALLVGALLLDGLVAWAMASPWPLVALLSAPLAWMALRPVRRGATG